MISGMNITLNFAEYCGTACRSKSVELEGSNRYSFEMAYRSPVQGEENNMTLQRVDIVRSVYHFCNIQGLSKTFERFKFGIFYLLIVKIRYNFTHK